MPTKVLSEKLLIKTIFEVIQSRQAQLYGPPAYAVILGAGASRSAGIPLASEMIDALTIFHGESDEQDRVRPKGVNFSEELARLPGRWRYEFIETCVSGGFGSANLTHVITANLAVNGVFGPIVTTNFDDLLLSAFWSLQHKSVFREPHPLYNPRTSYKELKYVAQGVPIIIKAHGHHTSYAMGVLDSHIAYLSPYVQKSLKLAPRPEFGFIVIGYSGRWADGVMASLGDRKYTRGLPIYWLYQGEPPDHPNLEALTKTADVTFVHIRDSDLFAFNLWNFLFSKKEDAIDIEIDLAREGDSQSISWMLPELLDADHLFDSLALKLDYDNGRFDAIAFFDLSSGLTENDAMLPVRRKQYQPILRELEILDDRSMLLDILWKMVKMREDEPDETVAEVDVHMWANGPLSSERLADELHGVSGRREQLSKELPSGTAWTRRNRKLLSISLDQKTDISAAFAVLSPISKLSGLRRL